ncbi:hypothetical protein [Luteococcus sediminum]
MPRSGARRSSPTAPSSTSSRQTSAWSPPPPHLEAGLQVKVLGALAHIPQVQDVSRMLYYLTGASTERQVVLAYSTLTKELDALGERAISETIIQPIKQQEPGRFKAALLWADRQGMDYPPYVLKALHEVVELHREQATATNPTYGRMKP